MRNRLPGRGGVYVVVAGLSLALSATAWGAWGTISDQAYQGGLVCRDGMTFQWADYTTDTTAPPTGPTAPRNTRLAVSFATPVGGVPQVPPGTPIPAASIAYNEMIHADFKPELTQVDGTDAYLIHQGRYQINWKALRKPNDTVRLIFDYPDTNDSVGDVGNDPNNLVKVTNCLLPRVQAPSAVRASSATPISVALLANAKFPISRVVASSIRAGGPNLDAAPLQSPTLADVNHDGRPDLTAQFRPSDMHLLCPGKRLYVYVNTTTGLYVTARATVRVTC